MDWEVLSCALATRTEEPLIAVDAARRIVLVTPEFARLTERTVHELTGIGLSRLLGNTGNLVLRAFVRGEAELAAPLLDTCELLTRGDRTRRLALKFEPFGRGKASFYLGTIVASSRGRSLQKLDSDYEVEILRGVLRMRGARYVGGLLPQAELIGRDCFEVVCGRDSPCVNCPPARLATALPGTIDVTVRVSEGELTVLESLRREDGAVRVKVRHHSRSSFAKAYRERLLHHGAEVGLSKRESAVFALLLDDLRVEQIALKLSISARTVRFHLANLLAKLGLVSPASIPTLLMVDPATGRAVAGRGANRHPA